MCEPTTMIMIGTGIAAASAVAGGVAQMQQQRRMAEAAEQDAKSQEALRARQVEREREIADQILGKRVADQGASGTVTGTGSNLGALVAERITLEEDIQFGNFASNAQVTQMRNTAAQRRSAATGALIGGIASAGAIGFKGAGQAGAFDKAA